MSTRQRKTPNQSSSNEPTRVQIKSVTKAQEKGFLSSIFGLVKLFSFGFLGLLLVLAIYRQYKSHQFWSTAKPPGELVPISHYGQKVHVYCEGDYKNTEYLVILDHGAGGHYLEWNQVQSALTKQGIASCSYDRLGYGYSSNLVLNDNKKTISTTNQLHEVLENMGLANKKLVFAGFSWGGINGITYSKIYPDNVKGLVLVDPGLAEWFALKWTRDALPNNNPVVKVIFKILEHLDFFHYMIPTFQYMKNFPKEHLQHFSNLFSYGQTVDTLFKELDEGPSYLTDLAKTKHNDIPIIVLNALQHSNIGYTKDQIKEKTQIFEKFASQYKNSKMVHVDTDHQIHMEKPEEVVSQIQNMLKTVKSN